MAGSPAATEPWLRVSAPPGKASALVLVLHGGQAHSTDPVRPWSLPAIRMLAFTRSLSGAGREGLVIARLRYRVRGWNGQQRSPVADARWALRHLTDRYPDIPIGLIGHSMGGRTAMYVADHPGVRSVVGLAPWIEPGDPVAGLAHRSVLIMHGDRDRITDPARSADFAERARPGAQQVTFVAVRGDGHAMLRRAPLWHEVATGFTVGSLWNQSIMGTADATGANVVRKALAGQPSLVM
jgi:pimeloyl-ACP methyl ester carboxylesterase